MDLIVSWVVSASAWSRQYLGNISLAFMAALIVLLGPLLNLWLKQQVSHMNFFLRTLIFMAVCLLGYGFALVYVTPWVKYALSQLNNYTLAPMLLTLFMLVGVFADRH